MKTKHTIKTLLQKVKEARINLEECELQMVESKTMERYLFWKLILPKKKHNLSLWKNKLMKLLESRFE